MNVAVIILVVVIVILVYYLYRVSTKKNDMSTQLYYLRTPTIITSDKLKNPKSARFSYAAWVFVNTWNIGSNNNNTLLYVGVGGNRIASLILSPTKPSLHAIVFDDIMTITTNFPIQKWVYVVISVDSTTADGYLDGKLVASKKLTTLKSIPSDYNITIGATSSDTYITGFKHYDKALNPQQVWSNYMAGNGYEGGKYSIDLAIKKDNNVIKSFST